MSAYEEIKSKAPHFMMLVKKSQILAQQGKIDEAYDVASDSLDVLDLVEENPNVLAAYIVATNVFRNYADIVAINWPYAVPVACKSVIKLMAPFLCKYPQNENCMSLMLCLSQIFYMSVMRQVEEGDQNKIFTVNGQEHRLEVTRIAASMFCATFFALKAINPASPMIVSLQNVVNETPQEALIFNNVNSIPEYFDKLKDLLK